MRWAAVFLGACGGDGGSSGTDGDPIGVDCGALPQYDLDGDCVALAGAFTGFAQEARACSVDADCRAMHPPCEELDIDCWYPVNACFTDALLQAYATASEGCSQIGGMTFVGCQCFEAPAVACEDHRCRLAE